MNKSNFLWMLGLTLLLWNCGSNEKTTTEKQSETAETLAENEEKMTKESKVSDEEPVLEDLLAYKSEKELIEKFGKENVRRSIDYLPEGMGEYPVTKMYEGTPDEVIINWKDTTKFENISFVEVNGTTENKWTTTDGVSLGMGLNELVKINEKAVEFSGFGWDYGGFVQFKGGKLDEKGIGVRLDLSQEQYDNLEVYNALMGDISVSSDAKVAKEANPIITSISVGKK